MNPPYVNDYYEELAKLLKQRLEAAEASNTALSFMVVVGANDAVRKSGWYTGLEKLPFCRKLLFMKIHEHGFIDGRQHMKKDALEKPLAVCDTGAFFLQSAEGAKKWPLTKERMAKIEQVWRGTAPSA